MHWVTLLLSISVLFLWIWSDREDEKIDGIKSEIEELKKKME